MNTTPAQRTEDTRSCRNHMAANVANTKLNAVSGQRKLMSLLDMRISKLPKNTASQNTPNSTFILVTPALTTFTSSATLTPFMSPICVMPILSESTPADSKISPIMRMESNLIILHFLVANELDAELLNLLPHAGTDQGVKFILKFIKRGMGVKLGISRRKLREQAGDIGFI